MPTETIYTKLFKIFEARTDVYAEAYRKEKRWAYRSIKKPYTASVLKKHILDKKYTGIGIYPLLADNMTKWVSADFDIHDTKEREEVDEAITKIYQIADQHELNVYKEYSKSGNGIHLWVFFTAKVESWKARRMMMGLIEGAQASNLSSMDRLFPSQDQLYQTSKGFGNLIHMPFSAYFIKDGCYFVDRKGDKYTNTVDDIDAWIEECEPHTPEYLDILLDSWDLLKQKESNLEFETDNFEYEYAEDGLKVVLEDAFMQWCRVNPNKVDYNAWIAMITNLLPYGDEGVQAIHQLSAMDTKRYSRDITQKKVIESQGLKPITYNWIVKNTAFGEEERPDVAYKSPAGAGVKSHKIYSNIKEAWGRYFMESEKKQRELSNFTLTPLSHVKLEGKVERIFDIVTQSHVVKDVQIDGSTMASLEKFRNLMGEIATNTQFYGSVQDLLRLQDYMTQTYPKIPTIRGERAIGMFKEANSVDWTVLTQNSAWNHQGKIKNAIYYNTVEKGVAMSYDVDISQKELEKIREHLFRFNTFPVCAGIMGWLSVIFVKQRLYKLKALRFPAMIIHGQAGSGKTETGRHILQKWFSDMREMFSVGDLTKFVFLKLNESTNMFPLFLDEYKPAVMGEFQVKFVSQMLRALYDQSTASRGRADQTLQEYKITSPVAIMGEQGFTEPALIERTIDIFLSKTDSNEYLEHFLALKKLPVNRLGNAFLNWTLTLSDDVLGRLYNQEMTGKGGDRPEHNIGMIKLGLTLLSKFFTHKNVSLDVTDAKKEFEEHQLKIVKETGEVTSAVDNILSAMITMHETGVIDKEYMQVDTDVVKMNVRHIYPTFRKWARETAFEYEVLSENEFKRQLRKMLYFIDVKSTRMRTDSDVQKAWVLDTEKLQMRGIFD